jgi:hypothetical protein
MTVAASALELGPTENSLETIARVALRPWHQVPVTVRKVGRPMSTAPDLTTLSRQRNSPHSCNAEGGKSCRSGCWPLRRVYAEQERTWCHRCLVPAM